MKIAFSARGLSTPSGGVHQFIKALIPALSKQIGDDELFIFYNHEKFTGLAPDSSEIVIKGKNRILWDFFLLPKKLRRMKIDSAIFPKNVIPFKTDCRCFVVIHDMAYFNSNIGAYPFLDTLYMRTLIPQSVQKAAGVLAVSENTRKDIIHYTNCNPQKITVTYEAADTIYHPIENRLELNRVKQKYNLPEDFIMYVGSLSPRKNINRLLTAFHSICHKITHHLVLTGSKSWKDSSVYASMKILGLENRINKLGYVEPEDIPILYNLADVFIYPSLYEGFGLPVLEAMQCGCPVVASNATSIPEVAGDAAFLVDPLDTSGFAHAIYLVLTDNRLREKLISKGFAQAKKFSWETTARVILKTIRTTVHKEQ